MPQPVWLRASTAHNGENRTRSCPERRTDMNSLYQQLVVFARLMGIVVLESCVNPRNLTAITIDHTGTILAERHSTPTWEGHPPGEWPPLT